MLAAHELRTPIQPILGLSEVLLSKIKNKDDYELIDDYSKKCKKTAATYRRYT